MTSTTTSSAGAVHPVAARGAASDLAVAVLDTVGLACAVVEQRSGRVAWVSRALETLAGTAREDVEGRLAAGSLLDDAAAAFVAGAAVLRSGQSGPLTFDGELLTGDGAPVPVAWTVSPLSEEPYRGTHLLLVAGDRRPTPVTPVMFSHVATTMTGVPVVATDTAGRVTYCNSGMERLLGRTADELLGKALPLDLFDRDQLEERSAAAGVCVSPALFALDPRTFDRRGGDRSLDLGELDRRSPGDHLATRRRQRGSWDDERCDWTIVAPDGDRVVSVLVRGMSDTAGRHVGYLSWAIDVTQERRTHDLLLSALDKEREAARRLAELDATRSDFVATASHELRTPVTSIRGYAEMMADGGTALAPRDAMFVEAILRNADRLCALADDLLVLCSLDAETEELEAGPLDLRDVVAATECRLRTGGRAGSLELRVDVPDAPVEVNGDNRALERALGHLLDNAVKFTEVGSVTCTLREEGGRAVVEVVDTGIGIPEDEQQALFTPFFRASAAHLRAVPGSGLGLSVVRSLVDAHGGEVTLDSTPAVGTRVTVTLPLAAGEEGSETRPLRSPA